MEKGFTLVEVLVVMAIFVMLIFGVSKMISDIFINSRQQLSAMNNIDLARGALSGFTNEIRNATIGADGSYALNQAGDNQIIFFSSVGASGSTVKRIRYYISGDTLYKGITLPSGSPPTYNLSSESVTSVLSGLSNSTAPAFYYYDGNYDGSTQALIQPVNINQVRFVKMSLSVLNQITQNSNSAFLISAGAAIRGIKDNLGN